MAVVQGQLETDSRAKRALASVRAAARHAGAWAHASLFAADWTFLRIAKWTASLLVALLLAAILWLYFLDWNTMRGPLERYASARLGRPVSIDGRLDVDIFSFR